MRKLSPVKNGRIRHASLILVACLLASALASCGKSGNAAKKEQPPVPVQTAQVTQSDVPLFLEAIGNVAAFNTVDVRSRVTGELVKCFFKAGDQLRKDQQIFVIDPAPYEAKLKESEAKLRQSKVQYEQAQREFTRFRQLHSEKAVSQEQLETKEVDMYSKRYQMELDQAQLESAKLDLGYCFITSPLDGQSGAILIDNNNIVNANQDRLVTIKQIHPIKVKCSVPGRFLDQIRSYGRQAPLSVHAFVLGSEQPEEGSLTAVDNTINPQTGMIMLESTFANKESRLWPGEFVRVRLNLTVTADATVVTDRAVNDGPEGQYVWVVQQDLTVAMRPIKVNRRHGTAFVVSEGLKPGENVVTEGQLLLHPGAKIVTREQMEKMRQQRADANTPGKEAESKQTSGAGKP